VLYIKSVTPFKKIRNVVKVFTIIVKYLRLAKNNNSDLTSLKNNWSIEIVKLFKLNVQIKGKLEIPNKPIIFVGNHISYLDVPVLLFCYSEISFVCKKEVKSWPIVGAAAVKMQTIFVERDNSISRSSAKNQIATSLIENNQKIAIFPSGTTSMGISERWKKGVFEIAEKNAILIQPFRVRYDPLRVAAYIDQDNFIRHLYQLFNCKKIDVSIEFHEPVLITNSVEDCDYWKNWCES